MIESLIVWLIIGAIAGWLAGLIVKGFGFGLIGNIVVGIVGAVIAGWLTVRHVKTGAPVEAEQPGSPEPLPVFQY